MGTAAKKMQYNGNIPIVVDYALKDGEGNTFKSTQDLAIASESSGTSAITLAHDSKYKITAGGNTFIFTTPALPTIPQGTVTSVGLSVPTGFSVSGTPVTSSGVLTISFADGYSLPTTAKQNAWDAKQDALSSQTAYTSKGSATKVPQITTNSLGQVTSITEVNITDNNDNQKVKTSSVTFGANDVVEIVGGSNVTVTGDATAKTITVATSQPTVNNGTLTLQIGGTQKATFSANQSGNATFNVTLSDLGAVAANNAITGATKTKITYDNKGLVTAGTDLVASDIPNLDAAKITSGTFADARISSATTWNAKYTKPNTGIPVSDLDVGTLSIGQTITTATNIIPSSNAVKTFVEGKGYSTFTGYTSSNKLTTNYIQNDAGWTSNIGTVTRVDLGTTQYSPTSGVISLPAYPTTLPASDVYAWAKAATKPSYAWSEITDKPSSFTPASHTHGNITNDGKITSTAVSAATGVVVYDSSNVIQRATAAQTRSIIGAGTYSKPSGGIPVSDLAIGSLVIAQSIDTSTDKIPTSAAVKSFVEGKGYTTNTGTVTSINGAGASGSHITVTGGAITSSGSLTIGIDSGYSIPSTTDQAAWTAKYDKPANGIPASDLDIDVVELQTELTSIGTASTFDSTSDTQLPTSLAVKNFVEGKGYASGTVTSVDGSTASGSHLSFSGSPITSSGTLTLSVDSGYSIPSTTDQSTWSAKQDALSSQTAYSAKGTAKKVAQITTNSLGQVTSISEVDITPEFSSVLNRYESIIEWGGPARNGSVSPVEAATIDELGHNKFSFLSANSIAVQYSRDAGATWTDYPTTNADKRKLVTFGNSEYYIGYRTGSSNTVNDRFRVVLNSNFAGGNIYCWLQRLLINIGTNGSGGSRVIVETRTITNYSNNVDTWTETGTYQISGWSGWNSIPISCAFGGSSSQGTQIAQIRLTFYVTSVSSSSTNLRIYGIRAIANPVWNAPSTFSSTGHIYSFDIDQNVTFPSSVYAGVNFYENGTSLANKYAPKPDFETEGGQLVALDSEGKAYEPSGISASSVITSHQSIKSLDTTATTSQATSSSEAIKGTGTIVLHKVSKTGSYTDLLDKPTIPQGTVTSVRVQAGTGLSSSQSTAQSTTLNTTISIASGYKLPTTTEWNNVKTTIYRHSIYAKNSNDDHFNFSVDTSSSTQLWDGSDWNVPDGYYAAISDEYGIGVIKASSNSLTFYDYSGNTQSVDGSSDYQETTNAI